MYIAEVVYVSSLVVGAVTWHAVVANAMMTKVTLHTARATIPSIAITMSPSVGLA